MLEAREIESEGQMSLELTSATESPLTRESLRLISSNSKENELGKAWLRFSHLGDRGSLDWSRDRKWILELVAEREQTNIYLASTKKETQPLHTSRSHKLKILKSYGGD
jgi:hypothetical protein